VINPTDINSLRRFDRSEAEMLEFLTFAVMAAGKKAEPAAAKAAVIAPRIYELVEARRCGELVTCACVGSIIDACKEARTGKYKIMDGFIGGLMVRLAPSKDGRDGRDFLRCALPSHLEDITGVGMKTSRFFLLNTRRGARVAALDVHILRWLNVQMLKMDDAAVRAIFGVGKRLVDIDWPEQTPGAKIPYFMLEELFLQIADDNDANPADLDLAVWLAQRKGTDWRSELGALPMSDV
jgi:hypothetical protein